MAHLEHGAFVFCQTFLDRNSSIEIERRKPPIGRFLAGALPYPAQAPEKIKFEEESVRYCFRCFPPEVLGGLIDGFRVLESGLVLGGFEFGPASAASRRVRATLSGVDCGRRTIAVACIGVVAQAGLSLVLGTLVGARCAGRAARLCRLSTAVAAGSATLYDCERSY